MNAVSLELKFTAVFLAFSALGFLLGGAVAWLRWRVTGLSESRLNYLRDRNTELVIENAKLRQRLESEDTTPSGVTPSEVYIPACEPSEAITLPKIPSWRPGK